MESELMPLEGKYYGTRLEVVDGGRITGLRLQLWHATGNPSDRELARRGITRRQWEENTGGARETLEDCHYESEEVYRLAVFLQEAMKRFKL